MLQSWRNPVKLFSDFNTLQFACVMSMVVFVMLMVFMVSPTPHPSVSADLPKVDHPISMPGADREDAMRVWVMRDGKVYFGSSQIKPDDLAVKIVERIKDDSVERKIYVVADRRARWGSVKPVLDAAHAAGIRRVAFLVDQRRSAAFHL